MRDKVYVFVNLHFIDISVYRKAHKVLVARREGMYVGSF